MVNVARQIGLTKDPDELTYHSKPPSLGSQLAEYSSTSRKKNKADWQVGSGFSLFDAEMRRRVWWEVYYYDLFVISFPFYVSSRFLLDLFPILWVIYR
jgi:hypothetical protein